VDHTIADETGKVATPRTTGELRAAFEAWDAEHNACTVIPLGDTTSECDAIDELWNIAREAVERLEKQGA